MRGTATVSGHSRWQGRIDITGQIDVPDTAGSVVLAGGDLTVANRIAGATVNGPGQLAIDPGRALHGFGTINGSVSGTMNAQLMADDRILTITGTLLDIGVLGTADADATLDLVSAWNTNQTDEVRLHGGHLFGATISNDGPAGINGHGMITTRDSRLATPISNNPLHHTTV